MNIITFSGASGSGKTTIAKYIHEKRKNSLFVSLDNYYLNKEQQVKKNGFVDFDNPASIDVDLLKKNILELEQEGKTKIPIYCFIKRDRIGYKEIFKKDLLILEGLYASYFRLDNVKLNIFINVDLDIALLRRLKRDINERNRSFDDIDLLSQRVRLSLIVPSNKNIS